MKQKKKHKKTKMLREKKKRTSLHQKTLDPDILIYIF